MSDNALASDLLRGYTDTIILKLLKDSDCYGYQIIKHIEEKTNDEYILKEATLYSCLKRLERSGDIEWYWGDETQGGRRKYFKITEKGKDTYEINMKNLENSRRILDLLL